MKKTRVPLLNQTVECWDSSNLSYVFYALSNPIRQDILKRLGRQSISVVFIAQRYSLSLEAVSKHIRILERGGLIRKYRDGRGYKIALQIKSFEAVEEYARAFTSTWDEKYDRFKKNIEASVRNRH